ncbi:MAG TPA: hypothetical protein VGR78_02905 [Verrucomicrobiae bacterium]|nr:hypothetical protein [Verrucomicrobiae bacterium]
MIGGSVASRLHGEPRQTIDADLVAALPGKQAQPLVDLLGGDFYADVNSILNAVTNQSSVSVIHLASRSKVDMFVSWRTPFWQSQRERRQKNNYRRKPWT